MIEVQTPEQQSIYQSLLHALWSGYGFDTTESKAIRFLLANDEGEYVGALAFEPFTTAHSINQVYPFSSHADLLQDSIYIIDALYLVPDKGNVEDYLGKLLFAIVEFGNRQHVKQFVALPYYELLVAIRVKYRVNFKSLGPILPHQNRYVIPSLLDVSEFMRNHRALYESAKEKYANIF